MLKVVNIDIESMSLMQAARWSDEAGESYPTCTE